MVFRLTYLCELVFGGSFEAMARVVGLSEAQSRSRPIRTALINSRALGRLVSAGFVNAEWLLCGTGPVRPGDPYIRAPERVTLPHKLEPRWPAFAAIDAPCELPKLEETLAARSAQPAAPLPDFVPAARAIYAARSANKPVILALGPEAVYAPAGPVVAAMLRKDYATGLAFTGSAAAADLEVALFGGRASRAGMLCELSEMHAAARLAAAHGIGYGEALGRWAYPVASRRDESALAVAYSMNKPVTVHAAIGEAGAHFLPAKHAADIGAAIGAASYVDMLVFTHELLHFTEEPGGVFLSADETGLCDRVFHNAMYVVQQTARLKVTDCRAYVIGGEFRRTLPALLETCAAVFDGSIEHDERTDAQSGASNR